MNTAEFLQRLKSVLPPSWFGDITPVLDSILCGLSVPAIFCDTQQQAVAAATRITTAVGDDLDLIAADFFGVWLERLPAEADDAFRARILASILPVSATRAALASALVQADVIVTRMFEPARPADTGAYAVGGAGYAVAGGWGNLAMPFQVFVDLRRMDAEGEADIAGYGTGGGLVYQAGDAIPARIDDQLVAMTAARFLPAASIAWLRIS